MNGGDRIKDPWSKAEDETLMRLAGPGSRAACGGSTSFTQQHKSNNLKTSLSQTLIKFYPLADRVVNNVHIDCSNVGVPYTEDRSHCWLSDLNSDPSPFEFIKFLPCKFGDVPLAMWRHNGWMG
ncbi:hypothetical protein RHMOL_Rhmol09G0124500 [Rhododendron molle]|uniref:Uncharacterized protein n=1 Tax=Rhododendron molle TaxID=49168 RepID=A0ACC0MCJ0_RHOML|nr:hypothetical protein RHMOL_Rhmol09G0124500 [Rhododendron molle]